MNIIDQFLDNQQLLNLAVKGFGVVFSFIYILFSLVMYRQTQMMNKTLQTKWGKLITFISLIQIFFSLFVFAYAILFI
jgi:EamA domain-containing membrane protein RarD